jgi:hypothetical protein
MMMDDKETLMIELKPVIAYTIGAAVLELIGEGRPVTRRTIADMVEELSCEEPDMTDELALDVLKG